MYYVIRNFCPPPAKYRFGHPKMLQLETPLGPHVAQSNERLGEGYSVDDWRLRPAECEVDIAADD